MEDRLSKALEFANYRATLNNQLKRVKVRAEGMLMCSKNGGNFTINQQLISFLDYLNRLGLTETTLLDDNNSPVHINDLQIFLKDITTRYFEVTNDYLGEYQAIRQSRNVKTILGVKEE